MAESMDGPAINAYGFVVATSLPPGVFVDAVIRVDGVRFAGRTVGSSVALVVAAVDDLSVLQDEVVPQVADHGATATAWTTASTVTPRFNPPLKRGRSALGALVRARTPNPAPAIEEMANTFEELNGSAMDGYHASALRTFGADCDVLLDIGAPDEDSLFLQLEKLDQLSAVTTYDVALARWTDNAKWTDD